MFSSHHLSVYYVWQMHQLLTDVCESPWNMKLEVTHVELNHKKAQSVYLFFKYEIIGISACIIRALFFLAAIKNKNKNIH